MCDPMLQLPSHRRWTLFPCLQQVRQSPYDSFVHVIIVCVGVILAPGAKEKLEDHPVVQSVKGKADHINKVVSTLVAAGMAGSSVIIHLLRLLTAT